MRLRLIPERQPPWGQALAVAMVCLGAAALARLALAPALHDALPYITFFPAVIFAAIRGGALGGALTVAATPPVAALVLYGPDRALSFDPAQTLAYLAAGGLMAWIGAALAAAVRRADTARAEQEAGQKQLRELVSELNHRAKNRLGVLVAIVEQSARNATDVEDMRARVMTRFTALTRAQDLLAKSGGASANLGELLHTVLEPFDLNRFDISNAAHGVEVSEEASLALTLVFHELATNALKYGALSAPAGRVSIACAHQSDRCRTHWRESDGPPVSPPARVGFGGRLLALALRAQGGATEITFDPAGVRCEVHFPAGAAAAPG
jgi:two-component sensor histidine kinase